MTFVNPSIYIFFSRGLEYKTQWQYIRFPALDISNISKEGQDNKFNVFFKKELITDWRET